MKKTLITLLFFTSSIIVKPQTPQLWLTTEYGGDQLWGCGTIIKSDSLGANFHVVYSFDSTNGAGPIADLCDGGNGKLYGITAFGGYLDGGVCFSYDTATGIYTNIHDFRQHPDSGYLAYSGMMRSNNGMLYGLTYGGGLYDKGVIYRVDPTIDSYSPIFNFDSITGSNPESKLIQLDDGKLYGMTIYGGQNSGGVIFSFNPIDSIYTELYSFSQATGYGPIQCNLMKANDNKLYGCAGGGINHQGVIFSYDLSTSVYSDLYDFSWSTGASPIGSLIQANNELLYGTTYSGAGGCGAIFSFDINTQNYSLLHGFSLGDGCKVNSSWILASDGKLYGTTWKGGISEKGTTFSFDIATNTFDTLIDFSSIQCGNPGGGVLETGGDIGTGLMSLKNRDGLSLSPNPASSSFNITYTIHHPATLTLTNTYGTTVKQLTLYPYFKNRIIYVDDLAEGIYLVTLKEGNRLASQKVIIQR